MQFRFILLIISILFSGVTLNAQNNSLQKIIADSLTRIANSYAAVGRVVVNNFTTDAKTKKITVNTNETLSFIPLRPTNVEQIYKTIKSITDSKFPDYSIVCFSDTRKIEELIPEYYRNDSEIIRKQKKNIQDSKPVVINLSKPYNVSNGLQNRHLAVWQSHGYYFNQRINRWEWQRPRLFQTVEDLYTQAYVLPFLVPMLENAGANVFLPRERDTQTEEIIIDNDSRKQAGFYREHNERKKWKSGEKGFGNIHQTWLSGENPFREGSYRFTTTINTDDETSTIEWIPTIPEDGYYAVYVSYKTVEKGCSDARYTVYHKGGNTEFSVNQTMNGGTWLYLGHFRFAKGRNNSNKVVLSNFSSIADRVVTADAVKFGGGMGNIARSPINISPIPTTENTDSTSRTINRNQQPYVYEAEKSGYPRFTEGARYWLQWAGIPDSIYSRTKEKNDYNDDFQSRGFWVNYLTGGSVVNPNYKGLGVPIDMAFAFHTDAGFSPNDSIIGTLGIYTVQNTEGKNIFKNGVSRWTARDLTDLIQTQIVNDIRAEFNPSWTRRGLWNRSYSESRVPEVPTMLLELLSHQNFADMRYGLDPRFRFTVSRAIYKGILKYLSFNSGQNLVVQPLPVNAFSSRFVAKNKVELRWKPTIDSIETSAMPTSYVVYTRINDGGFDNGRMTKNNSITLDIQTGKIYSFKVTAVNDGGESFPSEVLSVYRSPTELGEVLIINGFDRLSGPDSFTKNGTEAGFLQLQDAGVPWISDISFTGKQYDFNRNSKYIDNYAPGFGASEKTHETQVIAGNTFDYPYLHGNAIKAAGFSFVSCSVLSVLNNDINLKNFKYVDFIAGKQKQTENQNKRNNLLFKTFPLDLQEKIATYLLNGGNLIVSGAYIASDIADKVFVSTKEKLFLENLLKIKFIKRVNTSNNRIVTKNIAFTGFKQGDFSFYNMANKTSYYIETADIIEPASTGAFTFCSYGNDNQSAGVAYSGNYKVCALGFPFETIISEKDRNKLMESILYFLSRKNKEIIF
jgi:hypothetical protein